MKISQNWLKSYIHFDIEPEKVADKLTHSGLEVAGTHAHVLFPDGIVVGYVKKCVAHPNGDKLNVTSINIGDGRDYQIVCGASNIEKGQYVLVATVGSVLPLQDGGSLKIAKRKIRGEVSEGMVCSAYELGFLGKEDEIWVLEGTPKVGTEAKKLFNTPEDVIYDIDITPNRNDACSHFGVARELSALLNKNLLEFASNDTVVPENNRPIQVSIKEPTACPRYTAILLENVKIGPSPVWLQGRLKAIGIQPRNNIVDITNFITHDLGQPIHAFDYDQIYQKKIMVRYLPKGTLFKGLDGLDRKLTGEEIMICDGEKALAMGGIIGGDESKITSTTKSVLVESAYFDPNVVSKAARYHGISTDASYRFERGADPEIPYLALHTAAQIIKEVTGAAIASSSIDLYPKKIIPTTIETTYSYLDKVIGIAIPRKVINQILERLDIVVKSSRDDNLVVAVPCYRRDVRRPIDLVEEILRIYGYRQLPSQSAIPKGFPVPSSQSPAQLLKKKIRDFLTVRGFYEIKNNPFIPEHYHDWVEEADSKKNITLVNALNENYTTLPQSLLFGGLETVRHNNNRQQQDLRFFTIGKHYSYDNGQFYEEEHLGIWVTGYTAPLIWGENQKNYSIRELQSSVTQLLAYLGLSGLEVAQHDASSYESSIAIKLDATNAAILGKVTPSLLESFQLDRALFFATLPLPGLYSKHEKAYSPIAKYPSLVRDISLAIPRETLYKDIVQVVRKLAIPQIEDLRVIDLYQGASLEGQKSYTLRLQLRDARKTLQEKEVAKIVGKVSKSLSSQLAATIRE